MEVTFVSALLDLDEARPVDKSLERYLALFETLQSSGIRLHLFLSPRYRGRVHLRNGIIEYLSLSDLETPKRAPSGLPPHRNEQHDTRNFLCLMNAKTELVRRAIESQMHTSTHFAWIDFGICHMLRTPWTTLETLRAMTTLPERCLYLPGCWDIRLSSMTPVAWRFCGSFFVGDRASCLDFSRRVLEVLPTLPHLTWEVNVWAHLETLGWTPTWYKADHNDSIFDLPSTTGIVRVPPTVPLYWSGGYSHCHVGSAIEQYVLHSIRRYPKVTAVFTQSDGLIGQAEFDRFSAEMGHTNTGNTPAGTEYARLEAAARKDTRAIVCMLCTRQFTRPNLLLLPLDDDTFNRGLRAVLSPFPQPAWEDRLPKAFWRGGSSGCDRPMLRHRVLDVLHEHPNADVAFTPGGWPANDALIPARYFKDSRVDLAEHMKNKYILVVDGNCIASAHQWVFGSGSVPIVVSHPDNDFWFKPYLEPMVNYVPIKYDLSDLVEKLEWLVAHDAEAKTIAQRAMHLANTILTPEFQKAYVDFAIDRILTGEISLLSSRFKRLCLTPSDIHEHLPILREYASKCTSVVECGVYEVTSSYAFADALRGKEGASLTMVDPHLSEKIPGFLDCCARERLGARFLHGSDLAVDPVPTDLLFIDTWHVYAQLKRELARWHSSVRKYILLHDTTVDEWYGEAVRGRADIDRFVRETGFPAEEIQKGLWPAIVEFLCQHPEWTLEARYTNNNGLTILSRVRDGVLEEMKGSPVGMLPVIGLAPAEEVPVSHPLGEGSPDPELNRKDEVHEPHLVAAENGVGVHERPEIGQSVVESGVDNKETV